MKLSATAIIARLLTGLHGITDMPLPREQSRYRGVGALNSARQTKWERKRK